MFDLDDDPYELNNLVGLNGMTAANSTIIQAEHMRCLLLDWMTRLDGSVGYCSDPAANYGQGNGDVRATMPIPFCVQDCSAAYQL